MTKITSLNPMSLDDIKKKIQSFKAGSAHFIAWRSEAKVVGHYEYVLVKKYLGRFKISYHKMLPIRFESAVLKANTAEQIGICNEIYKLMSEEQKDSIAEAILRMYKQKKEDVANGVAIYEHEKRAVTKTVDPTYKFIQYPSTKNVLVNVQRAYLKNIKTGKPFEPEFLYFLKDLSTGSFIEITEAEVKKAGVVFEKRPVTKAASWTLSTDKIIYISGKE